MPSFVTALALGTAKDARGRRTEKDFFSRGVAVCRVISQNFSSFVGALVSLPPSPARILGGAASRTTEVAAAAKVRKVKTITPAKKIKYARQNHVSERSASI